MPINRSIPGQLSEPEMQAIEAIAALVPEEGTIVEVGALLGKSTWIWAKSAHPTVKVYSLDPWERSGKGGNFGMLAAQHGQTFSIEQFRTNVGDCLNVRALQGYSPDDFTDWAEPIDLYFEDAVHADPILSKNLDFWSARLKPSGIVCGHDYHDRFPDVQRGAARLAEQLQRSLRRIDTFWFLLPNDIDCDRGGVRQSLSRLIAIESGISVHGTSVALFS